MVKVIGNHSCDYITAIHIRCYLAEAERNYSLLTLKKQGATLWRGLGKESCDKEQQVTSRSWEQWPMANTHQENRYLNPIVPRNWILLTTTWACKWILPQLSLVEVVTLVSTVILALSPVMEQEAEDSSRACPSFWPEQLSDNRMCYFKPLSLRVTYYSE